VFSAIIILSIVVSGICAIFRNFNSVVFVLSIVLCTAILLFATEIFLRIKHNDNFAGYRSWGHKKSIIFGFEAEPNHQWQKFGATYSTDAFGFRTHLQGGNWPDSDGLKIFAMGGSSAFGFGLNDDETWAHHLENYLEEKTGQGRLDVINAGNNGFNSLQIFLRFYLKILPLKPTHIIFYENVNDLEAQKIEPWTVKISEDILFSQTVSDYWSKINALKNFYARTLVFKIINERYKLVNLEKQSFFDEKGFMDILEHNSRVYMRNIRTMAKICEMNNIQMVLVTFIFDDVKKGGLMSRAVRYYNQLVRTFAREEGIPFIDLEREFANVPEKDKYFQSDHYHPSQEGARYMARRMAEYFLYPNATGL